MDEGHQTDWKLTRRRFLTLGGVAGVGLLAAGLDVLPVSAASETAKSEIYRTMGYMLDALPIPGGGFHTTISDDPFQAGVLLAGTDTQGMKYTDSYGNEWGLRESGLWRAGDYGIGAIAAHPKVQGKYYILSGRLRSDSSSSGVYVTADSGKSWQLLHQGILVIPQAPKPTLRVYGRLLALDPSGGDDILYAASYNDGVYKTVDGGKTWDVIGLEGWNLTAVALHPNNPSTVYVGARIDSDDYTDAVGGVFVSTDSGQSWTQLVDQIPVRDLVLDPNEPDHLYVATLNAGVHRSVDGGQTWSDVTNGLPLTTPGGDPTYYNAIEVNQHRPGEVLVGTGIGHVPKGYGSVYRSRDQGESWVNLVDTGTLHDTDKLFIGEGYYIGGAGYAVAGIRVPHWDADSIYVVGRSGIWRSEDSGKDWYPVFNGLQGVQVFDVAISPVTRKLYVGIADFTLLRSDSSKSSFKSFQLHADFDKPLRALCIDASDSRVLVGAGAQYLGRGNYGTVFKESADGSGWIQMGKGLPVRRVVGLRSAASNPDVIYAALAKTGVFRSDDGGETFLDVSSGLPNSEQMFPQSFTKPPIVVHPQDPDAVYFMDQVSGLYTSTDGGGSWKHLAEQIPTSGGAPYQGFDMDPKHPERLYLGTSTGLYKSVDGGDSWQQVEIPFTISFGPISVDSQTGTVFAAALPSGEGNGPMKPGIYASGDGGEGWRGIYVDGPDGVGFRALLTDPNVPKSLYFGTDGGVFRLRQGRV